MKKIILTLLFFCLTVSSSWAVADLSDENLHISAHISRTIGVSPQNNIRILLPPNYIQHRSNKIYTPDSYSCNIRKNIKYCTDRRNRPLNGTIVNVNENNEIAYENYQNGYQSGITSVFNQSGILLSSCEYNKGVKEGKEITYFVNGNVEFMARYKNGALDGRVEQYDINGGLLGKMNYKKGWFKDGYCNNERKDSSMHERLHESKYNEIIPCGTAN